MRQAPMTLALLALVVAGGCATREVITPIYDNRGIQVELRGQRGVLVKTRLVPSAGGGAPELKG